MRLDYWVLQLHGCALLLYLLPIGSRQNTMMDTEQTSHMVLTIQDNINTIRAIVYYFKSVGFSSRHKHFLFRIRVKCHCWLCMFSFIRFIISAESIERIRVRLRVGVIGSMRVHYLLDKCCLHWILQCYR